MQQNQVSIFSPGEKLVQLMGKLKFSFKYQEVVISYLIYQEALWFILYNWLYTVLYVSV